MTATLHRDAPVADNAISHIQNARQVIHAILEERKIGEFGLGLDVGLSAVEHRLKQAVELLSAGEGDVYTAALRTIADLKGEILSLTEDLRHHQAVIAGFEEIGYGHLWFDLPAGRYTVEKRYRSVLGEYTDEQLAMQHLKKLRAEAAAKTTNQPAAPAAAEASTNG
jgi:hypothetical protein